MGKMQYLFPAIMCHDRGKKNWHSVTHFLIDEEDNCNRNMKVYFAACALKKLLPSQRYFNLIQVRLQFDMPPEAGFLVLCDLKRDFQNLFRFKKFMQSLPQSNMPLHISKWQWLYILASNVDSWLSKTELVNESYNRRRLKYLVELRLKTQKINKFTMLAWFIVTGGFWVRSL